MTALLHTQSDVTAAVLVALGLASAPRDAGPQDAWPVYSTSMPSKPDDCLAVFDTQGTDDGREMRTGEPLTHYGVQVRVRAGNHADGWRKAQAVRAALALSVYGMHVSVDGQAYLVHCYSGIGPTLVLGTESPTSQRRVFTVNALVTLRAL